MDFNKVHVSTNNNGNTLINDDVNFPTQENLLELLQQAIEETTEEHLATNKRITEFLHMFLVEPKFLANRIKEQFEKASLILKAEGLPYINTTLLDIVKQRKNIQEMEKDISEKEIKVKLHYLVMKANSIQKKINCLKQLIENADEIVYNAKKDMEDTYAQNMSMIMKLKEYNEASEKLETDLQNMQVLDLTPNIILEKYKQYIDMAEEEFKLDQILDQYNGLPPDLLQARTFLDDKQKEYEQLENTFLHYKNT